MRILWAKKSEVELALKNKNGHVAFYPYTKLSPGSEGSLYVVTELEEHINRQREDFEGIKKFRGTFEDWLNKSGKA